MGNFVPPILQKLPDPLGIVNKKKDNSQLNAQNQANQALLDNPLTVMPTPDDAAVQAAKRASIAEQVARRGRASTILTQPSEKLGS